MAFDSELQDLLKKDARFKDDSGELVSAAVQDAAWKLDHGLVKLLISMPAAKERFFEEIEGHWLFNSSLFNEYISEQNFLDNSYTRFRNKIGLTISGKFLSERGEVALAWPHKDCVLEGGQTKEEEKRQEIFFNEVLAADEITRLLDPKVLTNFKRFTSAGEQAVNALRRDENGVLRENLIIKGNNLIALHTLADQFRGQVKLIYIDPPYNTGGSTDTFSYNNGFKHSSWLTFIKNRLVIAKELLRNDGFIAVTIDHTELFYLGVLFDEIFGRENRIGIVTIYINPKGRQHERFFSASTEYMIVYAKNANEAEFNSVAIDESVKNTFNESDEGGIFRYEPFMRVRTSTLREKKPKFWYPIYISKDLQDITLDEKVGYQKVLPIKNGKEYTWKTKADTFNQRNINGFFIARDENNIIEIFHKYREQQVLKNLWIDKKYFPEFQGTNLIKKIFGENVFSYPKSIFAVIDTLKIMTDDEDIVLDFFGGSGTTAHAVLELNKQDGGNRTFIICEQMDYAETITSKRIDTVLHQYDDTDYIYCELQKFNVIFTDRIQSALNNDELMKIWKEMAENSFLNWYINPRAPQDAWQDFENIGRQEGGLEKQRRLLIELLDKNQLYVNLSEIDDARFKVSTEDKKLNRLFHEQ